MTIDTARCETCKGTRVVGNGGSMNHGEFVTLPCPDCQPAPVARTGYECDNCGHMPQAHQLDGSCPEPAPVAEAMQTVAEDAQLINDIHKLVESSGWSEAYLVGERIIDELLTARSRIAELEAGIPKFDPVVLSMLYTAADEVKPTHRGAVLRAYEYIRALLPKESDNG